MADTFLGFDTLECFLFYSLHTGDYRMDAGKSIRRIFKEVRTVNFMDISVIATIGFTTIAVIGVLYLYFASVRKK